MTKIPSSTTEDDQEKLLQKASAKEPTDEQKVMIENILAKTSVELITGKDEAKIRASEREKMKTLIETELKISKEREAQLEADLKKYKDEPEEFEDSHRNLIEKRGISWILEKLQTKLGEMG